MSKSNQQRLLTVAITLCLFTLGAFAEIGSTQIEWDQSAPVTWDLFRGVPPADAPQRTEAAAIHMTIRWHVSYSVSSSNGGATWTGQVAAITVTHTMEPDQSWVVPGKAFDNVLSHEQLHFDLNEVYRSKLECLLLETTSCQASTQQAAIDQLVSTLSQTANAILLRSEETQELYDSETAHSTDAAGQARWQALISQWLLAPLTAP
jgi:hypothetical protein